MSVSFSRPTALAALAFALAAVLAVPASARMLAKVDGVEISEEDVRLAAEDLGATLPQQLEGQARENYIVDYLIDLKLVSKAAEKQKMGEGAEFTRRMAYFREKVLMEGLFAATTKTAVSEEAMKKVYDEAATASKGETEVRARHILVPTEDEAKAVVKRLQAGEDFAKLAGELSKDPGSEGGDLGYFTKEKMVPEFADAAFKLDVGKLSDPVKSQFGWHVIKVEDKRVKPFPPYDGVKDQISRYVAQKAQGELITKLRDGAKIERSETAPAAPAKP